MKKIALLVAVVFGLSFLVGCAPGQFKKATGVNTAPGQMKKHD